MSIWLIPRMTIMHVEILMSLDYYFSIISGRTLRGSPGNPVAIESILGWMICGKMHVSSATKEVFTNLIYADVMDVSEEKSVLKSELMKFWEVETFSDDVNDIVYEHFNDSIYFNGVRYVTSLPFKPDVTFVPDNYQISHKRLLGLLKKLGKNSTLKEEYQNIIDSYEKDNIIEKVFDPGVPGMVHYLPHRPVIRSGKETTKIRIVFAGSSKEKGGKSINDLLYAGPCLLSHIYDILIRFCFRKTGVIADIKQAFLNIEICEKDKNYLRFLYSDPEDDTKIHVYSFNRVCFGITSSPFLLKASIKYHLNMLKQEEPKLAEKLMSDIYVDDLTSPIDSVEEGGIYYEFAKESMARVGLELHKWYSNSKEPRRLMNCTEGDVKMKKVLGVLWNQNDEFVFDFKGLVAEALKLPLTKRNILRIGAKFFDPMGLISPIVVVAKIYFQKVCLDELNWDDTLSDELADGWMNYLQQLKEIDNSVVPRYLFTNNIGCKIRNISLYGFCDSSNQAYCAVIYAVTELSNSVISRIVTSKTKVAHIKKLTIPTLELLSCLLLSKLMSTVCRLLQVVIVVNQEYFWSDSKVALAWIKGQGKQWKLWVQNRVNKIKQISDADQWHYVNTGINPADIGTRDKAIIKLAGNVLWWYGPPFIRQKFTSPLDVKH